MPSTSNRQASIDSRRIALEREITIRVPRFDTFVTEYSSNISTTGMFIVSDKPQAPGTTFAFEFSVADDWKLIRGKAQVVWTRYRDEGGERPAGMGVRFVELDAQSRRLIRWIVEKHIREGGKPFELDELRSVIDEALEEVIETDEAVASVAAATGPIPPPRKRQPSARRPMAATAQTSERNLVPLIATAAAIVIGLILLFWLTEWIPTFGGEEDAPPVAAVAGNLEDPELDPGDQAETAGTTDSGDGAADGVSSAPSVARGNGQDGPDPAADQVTSPTATDTGLVSADGAPVGSAYTSVRQALTDWAAAWSAQDPDSYLAYYSREFQPNGMGRSAWTAQRRERLRSPRFIKVAISQLEVDRVRDDVVRATFFQSYRSDRFSDAVEKTVEMVWESGSWKIYRERVR